MFQPALIEARNPGPMTGRGNNTYLVTGSGGHAALIDAGVGATRHLTDLDTALTGHGARLERVLATHGHRDHVEGAPALSAAYPDAVFAKFPWPGEDVRFGVDWQPLADGDSALVGDVELDVVHTPGHSPDHVIFWHEDSRTALTGDLVVLGSSVMIHWSRGGDLGRYLASLEKVLALGPSRLLPAHGPEITDPPAVLVAYIEHRHAREGQVLEALGRGRSNVQAIAESIYDGLEPALMGAACENVRAHLEKLKAEGRAFHEAGRWTT